MSLSIHQKFHAQPHIFSRRHIITPFDEAHDHHHHCTLHTGYSYFCRDKSAKTHKNSLLLLHDPRGFKLTWRGKTKQGSKIYSAPNQNQNQPEPARLIALRHRNRHHLSLYNLLSHYTVHSFFALQYFIDKYLNRKAKRNTKVVESLSPS